MADNTPIDIIRSRDYDNDLHVQESFKEGRSGSLNHEQTTTAQEKATDDLPPDGGYGWVCVASVFWINAHTWGINSVGDEISRTL